MELKARDAEHAMALDAAVKDREEERKAALDATVKDQEEQREAALEMELNARDAQHAAALESALKASADEHGAALERALKASADEHGAALERALKAKEAQYEVALDAAVKERDERHAAKLENALKARDEVALRERDESATFVESRIDEVRREAAVDREKLEVALAAAREDGKRAAARSLSAVKKLQEKAKDDAIKADDEKAMLRSQVVALEAKCEALTSVVVVEERKPDDDDEDVARMAARGALEVLGMVDDLADARRQILTFETASHEAERRCEAAVARGTDELVASGAASDAVAASLRTRIAQLETDLRTAEKNEAHATASVKAAEESEASARKDHADVMKRIQDDARAEIASAQDDARLEIAKIQDETTTLVADAEARAAKALALADAIAKERDSAVEKLDDGVSTTEVTTASSKKGPLSQLIEDDLRAEVDREREKREHLERQHTEQLRALEAQLHAARADFRGRQRRSHPVLQDIEGQVEDDEKSLEKANMLDPVWTRILLIFPAAVAIIGERPPKLSLRLVILLIYGVYLQLSFLLRCPACPIAHPRPDLGPS